MAARLTNSTPVMAPRGTNTLMLSTNKPALITSTNAVAKPATGTVAKPAPAATQPNPESLHPISRLSPAVGSFLEAASKKVVTE